MGRMLALGFLIAALGSTLQAQTVNVRGKVSGASGQALDKAVVELMKQGIKDTTGPDGMYTLTKTTALRRDPLAGGMSLDNGVLRLSLLRPAPLTVEVFDLKGNQLRMESVPNAAEGAYHWDFAANPLSDQMMIIKASIGKEVRTFRYLPLRDGSENARAAMGYTPAAAYLAKAAAAVDTLRITATGYATLKLPVGSLDTMANVTLTASTSGGEDRSEGCGKTPTLKTGNGQTFTSGSASRSFNLRIPTDYDNAQAYRLVVGIHWLNGTANNVSAGGGSTTAPFYGLWDLANPAGSKSTTIFVAPQGINNGWSNSGGADVTFITGLVQKLESEFCIDKKRVFAEGFSMGGSMSYALACAAPDMFRAVAAHSGGPMSGCVAHTKPVAYFMTHGTNDGVCKYPGYGVPQINDFAKLNGCTAMDIPNTLKPTDASGMNPSCADFQGCSDGHPARACIFVGDHTPTPGGSKSWVPAETWKFITKF
jgi:poly(3-hydroxybutyrate) depolymerase